MNWQRAALLFPILAGGAWAQTTIIPMGGVSSSSVTFGGTAPVARPAITGVPYSGVRTSEMRQTGIDGVVFTRMTGEEFLFRDSVGRTRTERTLGLGISSEPRQKVVEIDDPLAGYRYVLDDGNRVVHRVKYAPPPIRPLSPPPNTVLPRNSGRPQSGQQPNTVRPPIGRAPDTSVPPNVVRPDIKTEVLGTQEMEGVTVEGTKTTMSYPADFPGTGNDRPFTTWSEMWMCRELREVVLSKSYDPRRGESLMRLTKIDRSEPDPRLFMPPAGYRIVDEENSFSIQLTRP